MSKIMQKNKPFFYLSITFLLMIIITVIFYFLGIRLNNTSSFLALNFYFFIPFVAVFLTKVVIYREKFWQKDYFNLQFNANFLLIVYFLLGLEFLVFAVNILLPYIHFTTDQGLLLEKYARIFSPKQFAVLTKFVIDFNINFFWMINLFVGVLVGLTSGAFFAYFQEIGWRGFLYDNYKIMGFWRASLYIVFWQALFYLPLILIGYSDFYMLVIYILISPILILIRRLSGSVIYPAIFVGVLNSTYALATFFVVGAPAWVINFNGVVGIFVLLIFNFCLYFYLKKRKEYLL